MTYLLVGCEVCNLAIQRPATHCAEHSNGAGIAKTPQIVRIELVGEPRGKGRPRFSGKSRVAFTPAATRSYETALRHEAALAMRGARLLEGALDLHVIAYMPIPISWSQKRQRLAEGGVIRPTTRPDFDNLLKTMDALNGIVWRDDAQVVSVRCEKWYSERPRLVVTVECAS